MQISKTNVSRFGDFICPAILLLIAIAIAYPGGAQVSIGGMKVFSLTVPSEWCMVKFLIAIS
jgi:hypothetical protein